MALSASITCESSKINLAENVLLNYCFSCDTSGLVKTYVHYMKLCLDIDVFALLSNKQESPEDNEELLGKLRYWGKLKLSKSDGDFFRLVQLINTFDDKLFREINMSHAYVDKMIETVNLEKSSHVIHFELLQKGDKLRYVARKE